jgi:hypothetical protein
MNYINKPIYGIAYSASNSSLNYCDDWATVPYANKWASNGGAGELAKIKSLGFNQVRLYYLDPARSHINFLNECMRLSLGVEIPIHNGLVTDRNVSGITSLVNEVKGFSCVRMYTVGNEMDLSMDDNIAWAIELVAQLDPSRAIMSSTIFDANYQSAKNIIVRLTSSAKSRYIAGVNMYFYSNPASSWGDCLQGAVNNWFKDSLLQNIPLIISEIGWGGSDNQTANIALNNTMYGGFAGLSNFPKFLGFEIFSFRNEAWKGSTNNESLYGICMEDGTPKLQYQTVANFGQSGFYNSIINKSRGP